MKRLKLLSSLPSQGIASRFMSHQLHPLFSCKEVAKNVFFIQEKYFISWNLANIFFIKGSKRDLLVDTGVGIYSLPAYLTSAQLRSDPSKPLDVVLTHAHFDHSGGGHQFEKVHVHHSEAQSVKTGDRLMTASWVSGREVLPKPSQDWDPREYRVRPMNVEPINDRHEFDLGDRLVSVLHLPGHSPGSLALLDNHGTLVTGDSLYETDHGLIDWYPGSSCSKMKESVERLLHLCEDRSKVETILPGHNQVLTREEGVRAANFYLDAYSTPRTMRKGLSRMRASCILRCNQTLPLPEFCRELLSN